MSKPEPSVEEIAERLLRTWLGDQFLTDGVSVIVSALRARDERAAKIAETHKLDQSTHFETCVDLIAAAIREGKGD